MPNTREEFFHEKVMEEEIIKREQQELEILEDRIKIADGNIHEEIFKNKIICKLVIKPIEDEIKELRDNAIAGKYDRENVVSAIDAANRLENCLKRMKFKVEVRETILDKIRKGVGNYVRNFS